MLPWREAKYDRLWRVTGNVYIEIQALSASLADKYLLFAGKAYVLAKSALTEAIRGTGSLESEGRSRGEKVLPEHE